MKAYIFIIILLQLYHTITLLFCQEIKSKKKKIFLIKRLTNQKNFVILSIEKGRKNKIKNKIKKLKKVLTN